MSRDEILAIFHKFDTSGDGNMDKKELMKIFTALEIVIDAQGFESIFSQLDWDNNGVLNFEEFYHFIYVIQNCDFQQEASVLFYINDTDHNGIMDKKEMMVMLEKLGCKVDLDTVESVFSAMGVKEEMNYQQYQHFIKLIIQ